VVVIERAAAGDYDNDNNPRRSRALRRPAILA